MTPQQRVRTLIEQFGADANDYSTNRHELRLDLWLDGRVWCATDCHSLAVNFHSDRSAAWRSLLADIELGTTDCTDPECSCREVD